MNEIGPFESTSSGRFLKRDIYDEDMAIAGAQDIIAEWLNENASLRDRMRQLLERRAMLTSKLAKGKEQEAEKYRDYFEYSQSLSRCPSHRFSAIYRASREGLLNVKARPEEEQVLNQMKGHDECSQIVEDTYTDANRRLLRPTIIANKLGHSQPSTRVQAGSSG